MGQEFFDIAERRLGWLDRRQQVLAQNVANANTPGFRPHDLSRFSAVLGSLDAAARLVTTSPAHLSGTVSAASERSDRTAARAPDGNAVKLDDQLRRIAETETSQQLVTSLYAKYAGMVRLALGRAG